MSRTTRRIPYWASRKINIRYAHMCIHEFGKVPVFYHQEEHDFRDRYLNGYDHKACSPLYEDGIKKGHWTRTCCPSIEHRRFYKKQASRIRRRQRIDMDE